jgi:hypothetical protein
MLRIVVMGLIVANLLFFGWSHWVGSSDPTLTAVADNGKKNATPPGPPPCATLGPFNDELLAEVATRQLEKAGWRIQRRATSQNISDGWWVYVNNADAAAQARTLAAIRRSGMRDAFAMTDDAQFRVSVGLFSEEARAEDRAAQVQKLRIDALVTERRRDQAVIWLDLPGIARETLGDGRLTSTGLPLDTLRIESCPTAAPIAPASETPTPQAGDKASGDEQDIGVKPETGIASGSGRSSQRAV